VTIFLSCLRLALQMLLFSRTMASKMFCLVNDYDDLDTGMSTASKQITQELKQITKYSTHYTTNIVQHDLQASASEFLLRLLGKISPKLDNTLIFETSWSDGFYGTIPKKVTTTAVTAVIGLLASSEMWGKSTICDLRWH